MSIYLPERATSRLPIIRCVGDAAPDGASIDLSEPDFDA